MSVEPVTCAIVLISTVIWCNYFNQNNSIDQNGPEKENGLEQTGFLQLLEPLLLYCCTTISGKAQNVWTTVSPLLEMILPYLGNFIAAFIGGCVSHAVLSKEIEEKIGS